MFASLILLESSANKVEPFGRLFPLHDLLFRGFWILQRFWISQQKFCQRSCELAQMQEGATATDHVPRRESGSAKRGERDGNEGAAKQGKQSRSMMLKKGWRGNERAGKSPQTGSQHMGGQACWFMLYFMKWVRFQTFCCIPSCLSATPVLAGDDLSARGLCWNRQTKVLSARAVCLIWYKKCCPCVKYKDQWVC